MEPIIISASFFQEQPSLGVLGRTGEHEARRISFDCGEVLKAWPEAAILCVCRRPCDTAAYPIPLTADGTTYTMPLTSRETAAAGTIKLELRAVRDDTVLKSAIFYGRILLSLNGQKDAPGNPLSDALNRLESTIANAQTLADEIRQKLDNGEFVGERGPQGDKGDKGEPGAKGDKGADGSDATVTAQNIEAALGYVPVSDVQVAGNSVLDGGVAKVPIASKEVFGVAKTQSWGGTMMDDNGYLVVYPSTNDHVNKRVSSTVITPTNFDYAVKATMCDGKGAAWTSDEQKAARERMGVDKEYELIEEITTDGAAITERAQEPDGTPYDFEKVMVVITAPEQTKAGVTAYVRFFTDNTYLASYATFPENRAYFFRSMYVAEVKNGILEYRNAEASIIYSSTQGGGSGDASALKQSATPCFASSNITKVHCFGFNSTVLPAGFLIQIYGVRA